MVGTDSIFLLQDHIVQSILNLNLEGGIGYGGGIDKVIPWIDTFLMISYPNIYMG